jgi:IS30 family transposase
LRLERRWSPEQTAHQLRRDFPDDPEIRVTHETIYQALYVQGVENSAANSPRPRGAGVYEREADTSYARDL